MSSLASPNFGPTLVMRPGVRDSFGTGEGSTISPASGSTMRVTATVTGWFGVIQQDMRGADTVAVMLRSLLAQVGVQRGFATREPVAVVPLGLELLDNQHESGLPDAGEGLL